MRALRRDLLKKIIEEIEEDTKAETRERVTLPTTSNNLPYEMKRNLESLARAGYIKTLPDEDDADASYKRSIANLAKNGQLPSRSNDKEKRGEYKCFICRFSIWFSIFTLSSEQNKIALT